MEKSNPLSLWKASIANGFSERGEICWDPPSSILGFGLAQYCAWSHSHGSSYVQLLLYLTDTTSPFAHLLQLSLSLGVRGSHAHVLHKDENSTVSYNTVCWRVVSLCINCHLLQKLLLWGLRDALIYGCDIKNLPKTWGIFSIKS